MANKTGAERVEELLNLPRFAAETRLAARLVPTHTEPEVTVRILESVRGKLAHMAKLSAENCEVSAGKARKGRDGEADRVTGWKAKAGEKIEAADCIVASISRVATALAKAEKECGAEVGTIMPPPDCEIRQRIEAWAATIAARLSEEKKDREHAKPN